MLLSDALMKYETLNKEQIDYIVDNGIELQEGKLLLSDLSCWFGLAPTTLGKSSPKAKEKKMKILATYADYHFEGRSIIIDKVHCAVYSKARAIVEKEFPKKWGIILDGDNKAYPILKQERIDTCTRVGKDIYYTCPEISACYLRAALPL